MFQCGEFFLTKKMVKKGYYGNEGFGLAWDRLKAFKSAQNRIIVCKII